MPNNGPVIGLPANTNPGAPDAAAHNAEIAAKLAAQDIMGKSNAPEFSSDADSALDKLAALVPDPALAAAPPPPDPADPEAVKKAEELAAATKAAAEAADAQKAEEAELLKKADENLFKGAQ